MHLPLADLDLDFLPNGIAIAATAAADDRDDDEDDGEIEQGGDR